MFSDTFKKGWCVSEEEWRDGWKWNCRAAVVGCRKASKKRRNLFHTQPLPSWAFTETQEGEFDLPSWLICFPPSPPTLWKPFIFAVSFSSPHHDDGFSRSCHIPLLSLRQDTCLLPRMRCAMKAGFLWENWLSTVTSFPSLYLIRLAFLITPVFKALVLVSWQDTLRSGWVQWGGSVLILKRKVSLKTIPAIVPTPEAGLGCLAVL